jgi:hypothetical protein
MLHNFRINRRFYLAGEASLRSRQAVLAGAVVDISPSGIAVRVPPAFQLASGSRGTWLCQVSSPDLPGELVFLLRIVRLQRRRSDSFFGCRIIDIDHENARKLKAYRALALARGNPVSGAAEAVF